MNIGIDIDGVLTNDDDYILSCTSRYCYEKNRDGFREPYQYEYEKLDWNEQILDDYINNYFDEYIDNEPVRKFASEVIKKLRKDGHKVFIITAREDNIIERTKNWLSRNEIEYDKLIFAKVPKIKEIKENKIDLMIEDSPTTIPVIKDIVKVFCFDARYNQELNFDNLIRVFSWYDIYMKINEIK